MLKILIFALVLIVHVTSSSVFLKEREKMLERMKNAKVRNVNFNATTTTPTPEPIQNSSFTTPEVTVTSTNATDDGSTVKIDDSSSQVVKSVMKEDPEETSVLKDTNKLTRKTCNPTLNTYHRTPTYNHPPDNVPECHSCGKSGYTKALPEFRPYNGDDDETQISPNIDCLIKNFGKHFDKINIHLEHDDSDECEDHYTNEYEHAYVEERPYMYSYKTYEPQRESYVVNYDPDTFYGVSDDHLPSSYSEFEDPYYSASISLHESSSPVDAYYM